MLLHFFFCSAPLYHFGGGGASRRVLFWSAPLRPSRGSGRFSFCSAPLRPVGAASPLGSLFAPPVLQIPEHRIQRKHKATEKSREKERQRPFVILRLRLLLPLVQCKIVAARPVERENECFFALLICVLLLLLHLRPAYTHAFIPANALPEGVRPPSLLSIAICPTTQPHNHTTTQPHNHTTTQPHNHTTTQPHNHTTTQPHNHTTTQPHNHTTGGCYDGGWQGACK